MGEKYILSGGASVFLYARSGIFEKMIKKTKIFAYSIKIFEEIKMIMIYNRREVYLS